jgi:hypothetical protein
MQIGQRMWRATRDKQVDGKQLLQPFGDLRGCPEKGPPLMVQLPTAITTLGPGVASYVCIKAVFILREMGPVTTMPSAWRGEATKLMPNRARSKNGVAKTFKSASQALQPAADTWRSWSERPKSFLKCCRECCGQVRDVTRGDQMFSFGNVEMAKSRVKVTNWPLPIRSQVTAEDAASHVDGSAPAASMASWGQAAAHCGRYFIWGILRNHGPPAVILGQRNGRFLWDIGAGAHPCSIPVFQCIEHPGST